MSRLIAFAIRLLLCSGATYVAYRSLGPTGLVLCAPLIGFAFAKPILDAFSQLPVLAKKAKYHRFDGRYYEFRGAQIVVHEDPDRYRWVEMDAVRKMVAELPGDSRLARLLGAAFESATTHRCALMRADELVEQLGLINKPAALRLRIWLKRVVVVPSTKVRTRDRSVRMHKVTESENAL